MEQETKIKQILSDILEVNQDEITENFTQNDAALWDSMNNLRIVTALEEEFGVQLTMEEIRQMDSLGKIKVVVGRHLTNMNVGQEKQTAEGSSNHARSEAAS